jgi:cellulose synthase/poly-beta-1,6-N-acetylglucosamine synthase-like glycosyltransferase
MGQSTRDGPAATLLPTVSVIVPHYHDLKGLDICLKALSDQTYPVKQVQIVIADNTSPEGVAAVAAVIRGRAELVVVDEKGAGPARNGGVSAARGEVLAFVDSDCVPEANWLTEGVRALEKFDFVGGHVRVLVTNPARMTPAEAFEAVFAFDFKTYIEKKGFTGAGNLFCPRKLFDAVGGFRATVSEDVEWSRRAVAAGYRLGYAPLAVVGHPARATWLELKAKWKRLNAETYALNAGRPFHDLRWILRSALLPASAIAHTPRVLTSRKLGSSADRVAALATLYRLRLWRMANALTLLSSAHRG